MDSKFFKSTKVAPGSIVRWDGKELSEHPDLLAKEEPLEIRLAYGPADKRAQMALAVTMRTPGNDEELALGFLLSEGIIEGLDDIISVQHCCGKDGDRVENHLRVELQASCEFDLSLLQRNTFMSSSCGLCGKASIEAVENTVGEKLTGNLFLIDAHWLCSLSDLVREKQLIFEHTGGLHAAALLHPKSGLFALREDVGRHNALDKLVGSLLIKKCSLDGTVLFLSGRASFELIQKAGRAGINAVAAVGAPSSLAVDLAKELGICLVGFLRANRFNCYSFPERITEKST